MRPLLTLVRGVALVAALAGCGRPSTSEPRSVSEQLVTKARVYAELVTEQQDEFGFIYADECDSVLFSGLLGSTGMGAEVSLTAAEPEDGRWLRRPAAYPECLAAGASKSTISRDMLLGVMWWAWRNQRADVLRRLWDYGADHAWKMGDGDLTRVFLTPNLAGLIARMLHAMGEGDWADHPEIAAARFVPQVYPGGLVDFEAHLQVLVILLEQEAAGGQLSAIPLRRLHEHAARQPGNPLFASALCHVGGAAECDRASQMLISMPQWPADRLPTNADVCERYPIQRDAGPNWEPCPEHPATHAGADFLFMTSLIGVKPK